MPRSRALGRLRKLPWRRAVSPLALLVLWQVSTATGGVDERTLASPSTVLSTARDLWATGELQHHLTVSLGRVVAGAGLGVSAGVALALVAGLSRLGEELVDGPLQMLRTVPVLALVPLFILWFGIGEEPKILLVALGTTFPVYLNTYAGIRAVDPRLIEAGRTLD